MSDFWLQGAKDLYFATILAIFTIKINLVLKHECDQTSIIWPYYMSGEIQQQMQWVVASRKLSHLLIKFRHLFTKNAENTKCYVFVKNTT